MSQFAWWERVLLRVGIHVGAIPQGNRLVVLARFLELSARDLGVPDVISDEEMLNTIKLSGAAEPALQSRVRDGLNHRRQAWSVLIAVAAAIASVFSAAASWVSALKN